MKYFCKIFISEKNSIDSVIVEVYSLEKLIFLDSFKSIELAKEYLGNWEFEKSSIVEINN